MPEPRFNPFLFADMAEHRGWRLAWYKAIKCPCMSKYEGGAKKDCPVCGGTGAVYNTAVEGKATVGWRCRIPVRVCLRHE